jgi:phage shock protein A
LVDITIVPSFCQDKQPIEIKGKQIHNPLWHTFCCLLFVKVTQAACRMYLTEPLSTKRRDIMGIFTRFRDIVSANINAMLDRAEDPEKLIKLMIREMEDTLVELKSACAGTIASQKKVSRQLEQIQDKEAFWDQKAALAVSKGRDDLARQALLEKRRFARRGEAVEQELAEFQSMVSQYQDDIQELENKLRSAREKQRMLVQRHIRAQRKKQAHEEIRRMDSAQVVQRFDEMESHIERMEAEADLVNYGKKTGLEEALEALSADDDIERQLQALKSSQTRPKNDTVSE